MIYFLAEHVDLSMFTKKKKIPAIIHHGSSEKHSSLSGCL